MNEASKIHRGSLAIACHSLSMFECLSPRRDAPEHVHEGPRAGVERNIDITYQQPHLVPPMKLTVWDDMPPTPPPSVTTRFFTQSKSIASKASERASFTIRRRTATRPPISSPMPAIVPACVHTVRRHSFRPLELSIYLPSNRLSDLPEFDAVSFTECGEIKLPPRAMLRARSAEVVYHEVPSVSVPVKPASMFERRLSRVRRDTVASSGADSRPSSSYDALHSHPVSWITLPGSEPHIDMASRPQNSVTVLSPMQEEFTPPCSAGLINDLVSDFPLIEENRVQASSPDLDPPAPSPKVQSYYQSDPFELPADPVGYPSEPVFGPALGMVPCYATSEYQSQRRVSQWLGRRSCSASISTIGSCTTTTTTSFAEHRRKRSQFYMLSAQQPAPPRPLKLARSAHYRNMTTSTIASTVESNVTINDDAESMTTAPTATDLQSRSGTMKSTSTVGGLAPVVLRPILSGVPTLPVDYGRMVGLNEKDIEAEVVIKEINGALRTPIGMAF